MNRTIKDATVKRYHYADHQELTDPLDLFVAAYNHARRLKTLKGLTPYEYVCQIWTEEPERFRLDPYHHTPGLNTSSSSWLKRSKSGLSTIHTCPGSRRPSRRRGCRLTSGRRPRPLGGISPATYRSQSAAPHSRCRRTKFAAEVAIGRGRRTRKITTLASALEGMNVCAAHSPSSSSKEISPSS